MEQSLSCRRINAIQKEKMIGRRDGDCGQFKPGVVVNVHNPVMKIYRFEEPDVIICSRIQNDISILFRYVEDDFPNLLFAKDGEIFDLGGHKAIILGGAYSVDKYYRLSKGMNWFSDEQPSDEIKQYVKEKLDACGWKMDLVLSHTCPQKYVPIEAFMPGLDQKLVDHSTEEWLDQIENKLDYNAWYCGHWHIDKRIDKMHFLMHSVEAL